MLFISTLDKILSMMKDFKVDDKRFEVLKEARIRELKNMEMDQPHKQGIITFFRLFYFLGLVFVLLAIIYNKSFFNKNRKTGSQVIVIDIFCTKRPSINYVAKNIAFLTVSQSRSQKSYF